MVLATTFHVRDSGEVSNYGRIITANCHQRRNLFVLFEGQIIHSPTRTVGQVESERSISVPCIRNHHQQPLKFQRGLFYSVIPVKIFFYIFSNSGAMYSYL
jgi:hypothetical protein